MMGVALELKRIIEITKLSLYKPLHTFQQSAIKVGVMCVGLHTSRCLKEELAWAIDKWL